METKERLIGFFKDIWKTFAIIVGAILMGIGLWKAFPDNFPIIVLGILLAVMFYLSVKREKKVKELEEKVDKGGKIVFIDNEKDAKSTAIKLLEKTEKTLYYFGAAGFIGDDTVWKDTLEEKMGLKKVKFVRVIDLKYPKYLKEILKKGGKLEKDKIEDDIHKYKQWLNLHSKYLTDHPQNNTFFNFDGAPLWKYGLNYLIFDEKDLAIVFLSEDAKKVAAFIYDSREIAEALISYIDWITGLLGKEIRDTDLKEFASDREREEGEIRRVD